MTVRAIPSIQIRTVKLDEIYDWKLKSQFTFNTCLQVKADDASLLTNGTRSVTPLSSGVVQVKFRKLGGISYRLYRIPVLQLHIIRNITPS